MEIEVRSAAGRWDDFASFMVPRKTASGGCVCMADRNSSLDLPGRVAHMRALCESEPGPGVLAYVEGQVAAWCSVAPKSTYRALVNSRTIPHVQDEDAWSVVCFVVRPAFRHRGLMHQLLDGAVGHAHAMGATALEGYPVDPGGEPVDQTSGYVGTVQLFEAHGFTRVQLTTSRRGGKPRWLVRRELPVAPLLQATTERTSTCFWGRRQDRVGGRHPRSLRDSCELCICSFSESVISSLFRSPKRVSLTAPVHNEL